jgi:hypothetical protein
VSVSQVAGGSAQDRCADMRDLWPRAFAISAGSCASEVSQALALRWCAVVNGSQIAAAIARCGTCHSRDPTPFRPSGLPLCVRTQTLVLRLTGVTRQPSPDLVFPRPRRSTAIR